jgi:RNA polymerase sigma-54 factor
LGCEALERADDTPEPEAPGRERENGESTEAEREMEAVADTLERLERLESAADRDWQDFGPRRVAGGGEDAKFEAMNNTAATAASLHEELYDQFVLLDPTEDERTIGRHLIFNLDGNGFLPYPLEEILESPELRGRFTLEEIERVLKMVQGLEPKGVGARNLQECLVLQLDPSDPDRELKERIILEYLVDVNKNKLPKVASKMELTVHDIKKLVRP